MNKRLQAIRQKFRRPKNAAEKDPPARRDWLALSIAALSLMISVATAYFNLFRESDDVRMVLGRVPFFTSDAPELIQIHGGVEVTFINSGNRAVAITRGEFFALHGGKANDCRRTKSPLTLPLEIEAFVLKPGDIVVKSFDISERNAPWDKGKDDQLVARLEGLKPGTPILVCFSPEIITPDSAKAHIEFPLFLTKAHPSGRYLWYPVREWGPHIKPMVLFERTGTFLGDWWKRTISQIDERDVPDMSPQEP